MHSKNWDDLRVFLALCREGSATAAGRALGVNHTTVARRIRALEQSLGTRLFDPSRDGYEMTQSAENMYEHVQRMEDISQAIDREVFGRDAELKGPLKLTVAHDVAERLVVGRLREFRQAYPSIDLELLTTSGLVDLAAREADIALRMTAKPPDYLIGRKVLPMRHGVYGSAEYLRSLDGSAQVIVFRGDTELPAWVRDHFPDAKVAMRVEDVSTMSSAVSHGLGLARMPCYIGDTEPGVCRLDLALTPSTWGIWILSHVDLRSTARVRVVREFLVEVVEAQRALILGERSLYFERD